MVHEGTNGIERICETISIEIRHSEGSRSRHVTEKERYSLTYWMRESVWEVQGVIEKRLSVTKVTKDGIGQ